MSQSQLVLHDIENFSKGIQLKRTLTDDRSGPFVSPSKDLNIREGKFENVPFGSKMLLMQKPKRKLAQDFVLGAQTLTRTTTPSSVLMKKESKADVRNISWSEHMQKPTTIHSEAKASPIDRIHMSIEQDSIQIPTTGPSTGVQISPVISPSHSPVLRRRLTSRNSSSGIESSRSSLAASPNSSSSSIPLAPNASPLAVSPAISPNTSMSSLPISSTGTSSFAASSGALPSNHPSVASSSSNHPSVASSSSSHPSVASSSSNHPSVASSATCLRTPSSPPPSRNTNTAFTNDSNSSAQKPVDNSFSTTKVDDVSFQSPSQSPKNSPSFRSPSSSMKMISVNSNEDELRDSIELMFNQNNNSQTPPNHRNREIGCKVCHQAITDQYYLINGSYYHLHHWQCTKCTKKLGDSYYIPGGVPLCYECATQTEVPCARCQQDIASNQSVKAVDSKVYHTHCWTCSNCSRPLENSFVSMNDREFCNECSSKAQLCDQCGQLIEGKYFIVGEKKLHSDCYQQPKVICTGCQTPILETYVRYQDAPYHSQCWERAKQRVCTKCVQPISGAYLTYQQKFYHSHCLTCCNCSTSLSQTSFFTENDRPICERCYKIKGMLKKCGQCNQPISGPFLSLKDADYHVECFKCTFCSHKLGLEFFIVNGRRSCGSCARMRN